MAISERRDPVALELEAYRGRGTRGWRVEFNEAQQEFVVIKAGYPFGGEWPERQLWRIIDGRGWLSWHAPFARVQVAEGDSYRFEAGERRLLIAEATMRVRITVLE